MSLDEKLFEQKLAALEKVRAWTPRVIAKLESAIRGGDDYSLFRINPLRFAADKGVAEDEAVDLFLHAGKLGLFDMNWELLCPACAQIVSSFSRLRSVHAHYHCDLCRVNFDTNLDDFVEVSFTVNRAVRDIRYHHPEDLPAHDYYFRYAQSPAGLWGDGKPFVGYMEKYAVFVDYLAPGEVREVDLDLKEGWVPGCDHLTNAGLLITITGEPASAPQEATLTLKDGNCVPDSVTVRPGRLRLRVRNDNPRRASLCLFYEGVDVPSSAKLTFAPFLTGKRVLTTQTFRDLFRTETIQSSGGLVVKDLVFVFTDIKGSTELYERIGDLKAFALVQQHFETLARVVRRHRGAIIKTIGDAVMATFMNPLDAVNATLDMYRDIETFNRERGEHQIFLKAGVHRGYAIAVTLNDQLDYFGQTVNIAARVQNLANADEIYVTEEVYGHEGVRHALRQLEVESRAAQLKGITSSQQVYRIASGVSA
jgi:class 3 adenylate cyclase